MSKSLTLSIAVFLICPILILPSYLSYDINLSYFAFNRYVLNTLALASGVGIVTATLGTISSLCVTFFDFPGRRFFQIALLLPLALPAYITAFAYGYIFEFAGPVQTFLRSWCDIHYFPNIRSLGGAIFVMSFAFYPYVHMLLQANFISLGNIIHSARLMGKSPLNILWQVVIPISRPALISGVALITMEVIADFGTPQFFNIDTFTTGIYRAWFLLNDYPSAARLTSIILLFVGCLLFVERRSRHNHVYSSLMNSKDEVPRWIISKTSHKIFMYSFCIITPVVGFLIPLIQLLYWSFEARNLLNIEIFYFIKNTIMISSVSTTVIVGMAIFFAYCLRGRSLFSFLIRLMSMGYAVPSSVIAVGVIIFLGAISKYINIIAYNYLGITLNVMLIGTSFALLYAYIIRFISVSMGAMESGFNKIAREFDWVSSMMGHSKLTVCCSVHIPMLFKSIIVAFLLTFIDVVKELSATLIVRPFNFETISTRTYDLIMDERYREAAFPALILVSIGIISIILVTKVLNNLYETDNYARGYNSKAT